MRRVAAFLALLLVVAISGCTAGPPTIAGSAGGGVPTPQGSSPAFPLDAYALSSREIQVLSDAVARRASTCMAEQGFAIEGARGDAASRIDLMSRRYGVMSRQAAEGYGYHLTPEQEQGFRNAAQENEASPELTTAGEIAMYGAEVGSKPPAELAKGGCLGAANRWLYGDDGLGKTALGNVLQNEIFDASLSEPDVVAVFGAWATCLSGFGYDSRSPLEIASSADLTTDRATSEEITMAIADFTCKERTNLIGVWIAAEVRLQEKAIDNHILELSEDRQWLDESLRRSAEVKDAQ